MYRIALDSPLGPLEITEDDGAIARVRIGKPGDVDSAGETEETPLLLEATAQIKAYFEHWKTPFDLPLVPAATVFQQRMRDFMLAIPAGETRSYGEAARSLESAPRAVGQACGRNPIPIIVPCHRIIAAAGRIGGFSGGKGVPTKRLLLTLEAKTLN
jgi:methylated-DNA-[protein]-cysteine S-methyltransferase